MAEQLPPDLDEGPILDFPDPAFGETDEDIESPLPGEDDNEGGVMDHEPVQGTLLRSAPALPEGALETKPAIQTTEFWITLFLNVLGGLQLVGVDPMAISNSGNKYIVIGLAILNGLYSVGRGKAKQGVPYIPPAS